LAALGFGGAKSFTQDVTEYLIYCRPTQQYIKVLDTPGFKDSDGVEKDEKITK